MGQLSKSKREALRAPYWQARHGFKSGDIIAQSHGDWKSINGIKVLGVRVFTVSTYSHVGVIEVDKTDGHVYVIEAVKPAVHRIRLSEIGNFYHLNMRAVWTPSVSKFAADQIGTPYSEWDAFRAYFRPLPPGTVSECAALTRELLARAQVDLGPMSRPDSVVLAAQKLGARLRLVIQE